METCQQKGRRSLVHPQKAVKEEFDRLHKERHLETLEDLGENVRV